MRLLATLALLTIAGCVTTAGPFITQIAPAPQPGMLNVTKCMVEYNPWNGGGAGGIQTTECQNEVMPLYAPPPAGYAPPPPAGYAPPTGQAEQAPAPEQAAPPPQ